MAAGVPIVAPTVAEAAAEFLDACATSSTRRSAENAVIVEHVFDR
jgi:hypothetical protein